MIRSPAERCLSLFYYHQAKKPHKTNPSASNKVSALRSCNDFIFKFVRPSDSEEWAPGQLVEDVYTFVGVSERFDESVVLLAALLRVSLSHVLYMKSSKVATDRCPSTVHCHPC